MNIKEILFWIFLILSIILLLWYVFGNTPSEFFTIITIILMITLKIWSISDRNIRLEMQLKSLEDNIKDSFNKMKKDIELIKKRIKIEA